MGLLWLGRLTGCWLLGYLAPSKLLGLYGLINSMLILLVVLGLGTLSVIALVSCYFFMSVMFPTIFALGIRDLGALTKKGSSFLIMSIVGGALCPPLMGAIADKTSMALGFILPLLCFAFIFYFGIISNKKDQNAINAS
jgi:MFS transporter, FHS family, L-fucose permease